MTVFDDCDHKASKHSCAGLHCTWQRTPHIRSSLGIGHHRYGHVQVHAQLAKRGVRLASAQVQISLLSWGTTQQELVSTCQELDVQPIAYSPLALGLLTGKYSQDDRPEGARGQLFKGLLPKIEPLLDTLRGVAERRRVSMSQASA